MDDKVLRLAREIVELDKKDRDQKRDMKNKYMEMINKLIDYYKDKNSIKDLKQDLEVFLEPNGIAEAIGKAIDFKTSQLRKFFDEIKSIKAKLHSNEENNQANKIRILSLIPKLAYSQQRNLIDKDFYEFMKLLLDKLRKDLTTETFGTFENIFEAIVAYHKYHNPKEE